MNWYPAPIRRLIARLSKLPGIGSKTAERLAMHILKMPAGDAEQLARSIQEVKAGIRLCQRCYALSDRELCSICADPARDGARVCVVEQPADMVAIEKSGGFSGCYHILGGTLSPMDGIGPDDIRIRELLTRVRAGGIGEVILATGTSVEGESTAAYLAETLAPTGVTVSRIASGVPMGGDLKYVDQVTLKRALETRHGL